MKFRGTKITGSSILTILGVICCATVFVSAALIALTPAGDFTSVVSNNPTFVISDTTNPVAPHTGDPATYTYKTTSSEAFDLTAIDVDFTSGWVEGAVTSCHVFVNGVDHTITVDADSHWTLDLSSSPQTIPPGAITTGNSVVMTYNAEGTYSFTVTLHVTETA